MDGGLQLGWWSGSIRGDAICRSFPIGCLLKPASQFLGQSRLPAFTTNHGQNFSYVNVLEERNSFRARTLREKKENICTKPKNTRICVLAVLIAVQSIKVGKFQSFESPLHWLSMLFGDDLLGHYDTITGLFAASCLCCNNYFPMQQNKTKKKTIENARQHGNGKTNEAQPRWEASVSCCSLASRRGGLS